jgi:phage-related protein
MTDKPLIWLGSSRSAVRGFSSDARRLAGHELRQVQRGLDPSDWKTMKGVGPGVVELRIHRGGEYRVLYLAKFEEAVYVLHAFEKRTGRTPQVVLAVARTRLRQLRRWREQRQEER